MEKINVNDEAAFTHLSEQFVYDLQKTFRRVQPELVDCALIEVCAQIENAVFQKALEEDMMPSTSNVWTSGQAIMYYQELRVKVLANLEFKSNVNWKKLYDEVKTSRVHAKPWNYSKIVHELLKEDDDRKINRTSKPSNSLKAPRKPKIPGAPKTKPIAQNKQKSAGSSVKLPAKAPSSVPAAPYAQFDDLELEGDKFPDSMLGGFEDDPFKDLGLFEDGDDSLITELPKISWNQAESSEQVKVSTELSKNTAPSQQSEETKNSMWKLVQEETAQRKQHEEAQRLQAIEEQRQKQRQQEMKAQAHSLATIPVQTAPIENEYERKQREERDRLNREREIERKKREEEEARLRNLDEDNMMDDDWLS